MKKISYRSRNPEPPILTKDKNIPTPVSGEEGLSGEPSIGVGRGLSLPAEPTAAYDPPSERKLLDSPKFNRTQKVDSEKLLDLFVMIADTMDSDGDYVSANFADFMIKKIAEQKNLDYSMLFKDLLIKIVESDVLDKNKLIESLVRDFNSTLILRKKDGMSLKASKLDAYQAAVSKAEIYVR